MCVVFLYVFFAGRATSKIDTYFPTLSLHDALPICRAHISHRVHARVAGAAPPAALLAEMSRMGFELRHVYGLTEVYGPAAVCEPQLEWDGQIGRAHV